MNLSPLTAISPIDGRYGRVTNSLSAYFSEEALIKYRVRVEIEYFIALCELPLPQLKDFDKSRFSDLRNIYINFSNKDALEVKETEKVTNQDVKAVEYFIKDKFDKLNINPAFKEFVHFGLTSQDINNTSVPLSLKEALNDVFYPLLDEALLLLKQKANDWKKFQC
jgi:adenylosuccinate lyase